MPAARGRVTTSGARRRVQPMRGSMEAHLELHTDSHASGNATEVVWAMPKALNILGVMLLAHGCKQSPRVWFAEGPHCLKCAPRPEELCMTQQALDAGYAVIAVGNLKGSRGCWERDDVPSVVRTLNKWRTRHNLQKELGVPLYVLGVGSGGWFGVNAGRVWPDVHAVTVQASVPNLKEVQRAGNKTYPPLQMVLMERDKAKLQSAEQLLAQDWAGQSKAEVLKATSRKVTPTYFSDGISGLRQNVSEAARKALVSAGVVDEDSSKVLKQPVRTELRDKISTAMGTRKGDFPQRSKQLALDAIFARLDAAYGQEASTCEHMSKTLDFFARFPGKANGVVARMHHSHNVSNGANHSHSHNHSHVKKSHKDSSHHSEHKKTHSKKTGAESASASPPPPKSILSWFTG